jgi:hypothetical protein
LYGNEQISIYNAGFFYGFDDFLYQGKRKCHPLFELAIKPFVEKVYRFVAALFYRKISGNQSEI